MASKLHSVKVYVIMEDEQWKDIGQGQISTKYIERLQGVCILVHSELDGSLIMEFKIHSNVAYRKQQGDLILWSEAKDHGMAIHFQDPEGCQDIWEDICQVQGKDPNVEITQEISDVSAAFYEMSKILNPLSTPDCEISKLEQIANLFTSCIATPINKERLAVVLESQGYIKKILQLFHTCECLQNIQGLYYLHNIIKGILFLNKIPLFKILFSDECIMDVVGCLEYDPGFDQPKKHREFLAQNAKFREILPIAHPLLRQKIHQTYKVQYIHDILFPTPTILEENILSDLTTFIYVNKIEIVTMLQEDEVLLYQVFAKLKDNSIDNDRRRELLFFFKEFCAFSQKLQPPNKDSLFKTLIQLGIMPALKALMKMDDYEIKKAAIEIFSFFVEYNPHMIRRYAIEEAREREDEELLINIVIEQMISDTDPELASANYLMGLLRSLLDQENMLLTANGCERNEFLNFFYTCCMNKLISPLLSITLQDDEEDYIFELELELDKDIHFYDNYQTAELLGIILELLTFCVQHHTFYIKNYILSKNLLKRILVLTSSKHTFLILCAVRFMRRMIGLNDELYNRYIIKRNLFKPVINVFLMNGTRYNMLNSAIIELFEYIRVENIKSLVAHIVEKFYSSFESIEYVQTFKGLKIKYEEEKEKENEIRKNLDSIIYQSIYSKSTEVTEEKVKQETSSRENIRESLDTSMESDFTYHFEMLMKTKETEESENQIGCTRRKSRLFRFSSSYADSVPSALCRPHCSNKSSSVVSIDSGRGGGSGDYNDDDDEEEEEEDEDEDEEEDISPRKKPHLSS